MLYYYSKLSFVGKEAYKKIVTTLECRQQTIKLSVAVNVDIMPSIITAINYDHPEFYYVDFRQVNYFKTSVGLIYNVAYYYKDSMKKFWQSKINSVIEDIMNKIHNAELNTVFDKLCWIHNYFAKNISYDIDGMNDCDLYPESYTAYGALVNQRAVCEGISKAFKLLCDRLNLNCIIAYGTSFYDGVDNYIPHAWNIVEIEGRYCHIDVTWDINMSKDSKRIRYDYFCISDKHNSIDHEYANYPICDDESHSYFYINRKNFSSSHELRTFLERELTNNSSIYFRVDKESCEKSIICQKIQAQVFGTISKNLKCSYSVEMLHNIEQMCFLFRIKKQGGE